MTTVVSKNITAGDQFTDPAHLSGYFNLSISGTFVATVTVQRSPDGNNWHDVDTFTSAFEDWGMDPELMWYRVGVKAGEFTSGVVVIRIGQDGGFRT